MVPSERPEKAAPAKSNDHCFNRLFNDARKREKTLEKRKEEAMKNKEKEWNNS